jgi:hypothetical protein
LCQLNHLASGATVSAGQVLALPLITYPNRIEADVYSSITWSLPAKFFSRGKHVVTLKLWEAVEAWLALSPAARKLVELHLDQTVDTPYGRVSLLDEQALRYLSSRLHQMRSR